MTSARSTSNNQRMICTSSFRFRKLQPTGFKAVMRGSGGGQVSRKPSNSTPRLSLSASPTSTNGSTQKKLTLFEYEAFSQWCEAMLCCRQFMILKDSAFSAGALRPPWSNRLAAEGAEHGGGGWKAVNLAHYPRHFTEKSRDSKLSACN